VLTSPAILAGCTSADPSSNTVDVVRQEGPSGLQNQQQKHAYIMRCIKFFRTLPRMGWHTLAYFLYFVAPDGGIVTLFINPCRPQPYFAMALQRRVRLTCLHLRDGCLRAPQIVTKSSQSCCHYYILPTTPLIRLSFDRDKSLKNRLTLKRKAGTGCRSGHGLEAGRMGNGDER
jgi:hypothetical protein